MAKVSSGSFTTSSSEGRSLTFNWSVDSTSIAGNYKKIYWSLVGSGSYNGYIMAGNFKVVIDGETVYEKGSDYRIQLWQGTVVASGYKTLYHNNTGEKSFSASVNAGIYTYARNCSGSGSWELPTIPRYAKFTAHSITARTENTVTVNWNADSECDNLQYSLNGGAWTGISGYPNYTVSGLSANTNYNIKTRIRRKDSQLWTESSALSFTTYDYPYCTESPNFVLGNTVTLKFYNPLNRAFNFYIIGNGTEISAKWENKTGTSYTGLSSNETTVPQLYATIPNAKTGKYQVKVVYGSSTKIRNNGNTYSIKGNETPTFTNFTYKDTNSTVTNITGNNQILVKGKSNLQVTISSANKMVAKNSATGKNYIALIDTLNNNVNYSTGDINLVMGSVVNSGTKRLTITAYDSRTLSKSVYKDITVYDYAKPVINSSITRFNNFENQTTLKVSGTYSRLTIGGTDKNTVTSIKYRYREKNSTWGSWVNLTATISAGKFTCSDVILSLDNTKSFEFQVQAVDKLDTTTKNMTVNIGEAIFFISTNKKNCYINGTRVVEKITGNNCIATKFYDGTLICEGTYISGTVTLGPWGNLYSYDFDTNITYPVSFINIPHVVSTISNNNAGLIIRNTSSATMLKTICVARPTSGDFYFAIDWIAIGRWK